MQIFGLQIIADISKITKSADRDPMLIFYELLKSAITFSQKSLLFLKKKKKLYKTNTSKSKLTRGNNVELHGNVPMFAELKRALKRFNIITAISNIKFWGPIFKPKYLENEAFPNPYFLYFFHSILYCLAAPAYLIYKYVCFTKVTIY